MTAYFVTATGTDIGKTFVTAGLIRHLRAQGRSVLAIKPIASGFDMASAAESDPGVLLEALGDAVTPDALDRIAPWRFAAPLSPDMAAAREGKSLDFDAIVAFCRKAMAAKEGPLFIEGVGGLMVPLDHSKTVMDWMAAMNIPVILIAGSYLGTISHTLTALECLARRGLNTRALVINQSDEGAVPLDETLATLARFTGNLPIATIPRVRGAVDGAENFAALWHTIG